MRDFSMYKPQRLIWLFLSCLILFVVFFPYLRTEYSTWRHGSKIDVTRYCASFGSESTLNYYKLLSYQVSRGQAEIYCIFKNSQQNVYLQLEQQGDNWKVIYSRLLNSEGVLYFPFYI